MRFRLTTIAYLFALLAAGFAAMGGMGGAVALFILGVWAVVFRKAPHPTLGEYLVIAAMILILTALLLPAISQARPAAIRSWCQNNLKILALRALNYESANRQFPPPILRDGAGAPLHSWRTILLPFMEQSALYGICRRQLPWNHPSNATFANTAIEIYECPARRDADPRLTSYFAVVDDRTMWPPNRTMMLRDVTDGSSNTILLLEAPSRGKLWAQPEDLTFDEAVTLLTTRPKLVETPHFAASGYFYKPTPAIGVAFADGSVDHLPLPLPRETAVALLTAAGDEHIDTSQLDNLVKHELDYAKCYAMALFVAIALAPGLRLIRRNHAPTDPDAGRDSPHLEHPL